MRLRVHGSWLTHHVECAILILSSRTRMVGGMVRRPYGKSRIKIFKASDSAQQRFLSLPETGMGYQIIEARRYGKTYKDRVKDRFVVYNSELIIDLDDQLRHFNKQIITEGYSKMLGKATLLPIEISTISLVARSQVTESRTLTASKKKSKGRHSGGKGAIENPKEKANGKKKFVRLSAYENDRRIDFNNKKLRPGSYTTTDVDYCSCLTYDDDPIDRYALPSDAQIRWAFYVLPKSDDTLQRGIVQAAFGHDGGGLEAYFQDGTSDNTYHDKRPYGK
jgi:hypothetical protein